MVRHHSTVENRSREIRMESPTMLGGHAATSFESDRLIIAGELVSTQLS
ncbi:hypothetical protein SynBIOSU31_01201 [Synechococcus sp. BIOS-U3-1]|nr:hypothetical protein SynBIOSU31_01201 [Synechococcus sp. BIOS-U3-1]